MTAQVWKLWQIEDKKLCVYETSGKITEFSPVVARVHFAPQVLARIS